MDGSSRAPMRAVSSSEVEKWGACIYKREDKGAAILGIG